MTTDGQWDNNHFSGLEHRMNPRRLSRRRFLKCSAVLAAEAGLALGSPCATSGETLLPPPGVGARDDEAATLGLCRGLRQQAGRAVTPLLVLVRPAQRAGLPQIIRLDQWPATEGDSALKDVAQFANITRPRIRL